MEITIRIPNPKKKEFKKDLKECLVLAKKNGGFYSRLFDEDTVKEMRKRISYERNPAIEQSFRDDIERFESRQEMKAKFAAFYEKYAHDTDIVPESGSIVGIVERKKPSTRIRAIFGAVVMTLGISYVFLKDWLTGELEPFLGMPIMFLVMAYVILNGILKEGLDSKYNILIDELTKIGDAKQREKHLQDLKDYNKKHGWD